MIYFRFLRDLLLRFRARVVFVVGLDCEGGGGGGGGGLGTRGGVSGGGCGRGGI